MKYKWMCHERLAKVDALDADTEKHNDRIQLAINVDVRCNVAINLIYHLRNVSQMRCVL